MRWGIDLPGWGAASGARRANRRCNRSQSDQSGLCRFGGRIAGPRKRGGLRRAESRDRRNGVGRDELHHLTAIPEAR